MDPHWILTIQIIYIIIIRLASLAWRFPQIIGTQACDSLPYSADFHGIAERKLEIRYLT